MTADRRAAKVGAGMIAIPEGTVAPARRPRGWLAPGPAPRTPEGRRDVWPALGEDLCFLAGNWRILQKRRGHRWSLDDLVTAFVAAEEARGTAPTTRAGARRRLASLEVSLRPRPLLIDARSSLRAERRISYEDVETPARILDLGCGIGAVLLMLAWRFPAARCVGVEAQAESARLALRSIAWNGVDDRCRVEIGDLRTFTGAGFDLVTGTPPYLPPGSATEPLRAEQPGSHIEHRGGIEEYCRTAASALGDGGRFVFCHQTSRIARVERAADDAGLAILHRLDVVPREGKPPLFSVFAAGRSRAGLPRTSRLVVRDADGRRTAAFESIRAAFGMPPLVDGSLAEGGPRA